MGEREGGRERKRQRETGGGGVNKFLLSENSHPWHCTILSESDSHAIILDIQW